MVSMPCAATGAADHYSYTAEQVRRVRCDGAGWDVMVYGAMVCGVVVCGATRQDGLGWGAMVWGGVGQDGLGWGAMGWGGVGLLWDISTRQYHSMSTVGSTHLDPT